MAAYSSTVSPDSSSDSWSIACSSSDVPAFSLAFLKISLAGQWTCVTALAGKPASNCRSNVDVEAVVCQLRGGSGIGEALRLAFIDSAALVRGKRREELRVP